jgi:hypothetical protein
MQVSAQLLPEASRLPPMTSLLSLWLPILLSAVVVFVISSLVHMVIKWHAFDYKGFGNEESVRAALRTDHPVLGVKYVVPHCADMKEMTGEAMRKKYREGPTAVVVFGPNAQPNLGKNLGQWFILSLVIAAATACVTAQFVSLDPASATRAAKLASTITFIAYAFGTVQESIWMYRSWRSTATYIADAVLYALGTGAVFFWLWK